MSSANLPFDISKEISKSLMNVNYSQWERKRNSVDKTANHLKDSSNTNVRGQTQQPQQRARNSAKRTSSAKTVKHQCTSSCKHDAPKLKKEPSRHMFKTKRQREEEEKERNLLKIKIKFAKDYIDVLRRQEAELMKQNVDLIATIEKSEMTSNRKVDGILRNYEKFQIVKNKLSKHHFDEIQGHKEQLEVLNKDLNKELENYQNDLDKIERELRDAQELAKHLSVYKNQEYPEKQLQIVDLRKKMQNIFELHAEEQESLIDIIEHERNEFRNSEIEQSKHISDKISSKAIADMHGSLKEMVHYNSTLKREYDLHRNLVVSLKEQIVESEKSLSALRLDPKRSIRNAVFSQTMTKKAMYDRKNCQNLTDTSEKKATVQLRDNNSWHSEFIDHHKYHTSQQSSKMVLSS